MAANFNVTASNLTTGASNLMELNANFKAQVENLVATEASLNSMWEGEARDAFRRVFEEDKEQLNRFALLVDRYIETLNQIADNYRKAEETNTSIAATRTH